MKTGLMLLVAILSLSFFGCSNSTGVIGDKKLSEVKISQEIFLAQIDYYHNQIAGLQKENNQMSKIDAPLDSRKEKIAANDKMIMSYRAKVDTLENQTNEFISKAAGKDNQTAFNFQGDPKEIAEAYVLIEYAQGKQHGVKQEESGHDSLKAIIVNDWRYSVIAKVTGPAGYSREFRINSREKSPIFVLPVIGRYTTRFSTRAIDCDDKFIEKPVGPNIIYYDGDIAYDYRVTLPEE